MNILEVKNLSKVFYINKARKLQKKYLREDLLNYFKKIVSRTKTEKKDEFWALKGINLSLKGGDSLGIIGSNGAGKSTLLKIIAGVNLPSTGEVVIYGKIATLLSVGTGFHSELTGRDNIFLGGAVLGFKKSQIERALANIIEFSGIGKFIDTPVKFYSSGMYVRLAFSVATAEFVKPNLLILDEVLSVGDANFQLKSIKRIKQIIKENNAAVIFVSHDLKKIRNLCSRCLWIESGEIKLIGEPKLVINEYLKTT